jgi:hypothetical protein
MPEEWYEELSVYDWPDLMRPLLIQPRCESLRVYLDTIRDLQPDFPAFTETMVPSP